MPELSWEENSRLHMIANARPEMLLPHQWELLGRTNEYAVRVQEETREQVKKTLVTEAA